MDLLFKNEMYDEVMQVADIVQDKQISSNRFPRNVVVLTMAAAYKKVIKLSFHNKTVKADISITYMIELSYETVR